MSDLDGKTPQQLGIPEDLLLVDWASLDERQTKEAIGHYDPRVQALILHYTPKIWVEHFKIKNIDHVRLGGPFVTFSLPLSDAKLLLYNEIELRKLLNQYDR